MRLSLTETLYDYISAHLSVPLVTEPLNGPREADVFVSMLITPAQLGRPSYGPVQDDGTRAISAAREVSVRLQCFGTGAWDVLDTLSLSLVTDSAQDTAEGLNISLVGVSDLQFVPALLDTATYEDRAILTLQILSTSVITETVGFIERVEGSLKVEDLAETPFVADVRTEQSDQHLP